MHFTLRTAENQPRRKLSVLTKKKIVQYWLTGLKTESQIFQQYGINRKLLEDYHKWYYHHFQQARGVSPKILKKMTEKEKIKELERRNRELEKL